MANPYSVTVNTITTDGTNTYVTFSVFDGLHTSPQMTAEFPASASATTIQNYLQTVANNQPSLSTSLGALVSATILGQ